MKILITGSSGVIGSALCKEIAGNGVDVIPFDIKHGFNVCDKGQLLSKVNDIDGVIHCAAIPRVSDCKENPALCKEVNIVGTKNVVECLHKTANKPWLLFLSSREVYGQASDFPVTENFLFNPMNEYAVSKVEGEKIAVQYPGCCVVRLTNVYGSEADYKNRVVLAFAKAAITGEPLLLNGANNVLDFVHINDVVNGITLCIKKQSHGTINLASGVGVSLRTLAEKIIHLTNSKSQIMERPANKNEVSYFYGDPGKAKQMLNWQVRVSLEQGLKKLIEDIKCKS
jgi:nucleoside-diphosphate-sugar epimerase